MTRIRDKTKREQASQSNNQSTNKKAKRGIKCHALQPLPAIEQRVSPDDGGMSPLFLCPQRSTSQPSKRKASRPWTRRSLLWPLLSTIRAAMTALPVWQGTSLTFQGFFKCCLLMTGHLVDQLGSNSTRWGVDQLGQNLKSWVVE